MNKDYVCLGSSPVNENCAQVGKDDYFEKSRIELRAFRNQLIRVFGDPPYGAVLCIKAFPHDFGTYYELVCVYDRNETEAEEYAYTLEDNIPERWDKVAIAELTNVTK